MQFTRSDHTYDSNYEKTPEFFDELSPLFQIVKLIPEGSAVLDIGAGNGTFSRMLQHYRAKIDIDGVEPNVYASTIAKDYYRNFWVDYLENLDSEIPFAEYDFIVIADVVEHLSNPLSFLETIKMSIRDDCKLIISMPNIGFGAIRLSLLNGVFEYVPSGIIEYTHLRFYTLESIKSLMNASKINIEKIISINRSYYRCEIPVENLKCSIFTLIKIICDSRSRGYQYILVANKGIHTDTINKEIGCAAIQIVIDRYFIPFKKLIKSKAPQLFQVLKSVSKFRFK
jgi:2-polyprenyl-3-methyl-5-hydroxy-6-metoxy-1,4-benzoquinol methylase